MKRFVQRQPFVCLAIVTIAIGAAWHALGPELRGSSAPVMNVVGAPFIASKRLARQLAGASAVTPLLGTLLGLVPYVLADWLLARARMRRAAPEPEQPIA